MTRDEILNMPAGEEIDKLVAEKVMGWHIVEIRDGGRNQFVDSDGHYQHIVSRYDYYEDGEDFNTICWHPSESILWAWEVVEKLKEYSLWIDLNASPDGYQVGFADYFVFAESAPLAICRAALLCVVNNG